VKYNLTTSGFLEFKIKEAEQSIEVADEVIEAKEAFEEETIVPIVRQLSKKTVI